MTDGQSRIESTDLERDPELPDNRSRTRVIKVKDRMFC